MHRASQVANPCRRCALTPVSEQDWVRATQQQFTPDSDLPAACGSCRAGARCPMRRRSICAWIPASPSAPAAIPPPGNACAGWKAICVAGESVLDYGCGSGILAIAAQAPGGRAGGRCGHRSAALWSQPRQCSSQRRSRFTSLRLTQVPPGPYDVVVANILSNPLRMLAPLLAGFTRSGGRIVLAGILTQQAEALDEAYSPWFEIRSRFPRRTAGLVWPECENPCEEVDSASVAPFRTSRHMTE